jgi:pimeloyl-ACP methyl ester carboxylesterase
MKINILGKRIDFLFCVSILLLLISQVFNPVIVSSKSNISITDDPWNDGFFNVDFIIEKTSQTGSINGVINLGINDFRGIINGKWQLNDGSENGILKGIVLNSKIFGLIYSGNIPLLFFGSVLIDEADFSINIKSLKYGEISGNGYYEASFLPPLTGDFSVGVKKIHLIDESRLEWFSEEILDDFREMMIQIWYPTSDVSNNNVFYMDDITFQWLKGRSPIPLVSIPPDAYKYVHPHGYDNPEIDKSMSSYPVILFCHGYDGVDSIYTTLIEDLVSNGFIVVSINHPYVAGVTVFPDGRSVDIAPVPENDSSFFDRSFQTVIDDAIFVLDTLTVMNDEDEFFKGCFDLSRVGMYGHSFGGAATQVCCIIDPRIDAGLTLDGVVYPDFLTDNISKPFLMMLAEERYNHSSVDLIWDYLNNDAYKIGVSGSTHYGYTDVGILLSHLLPMIPSELLGFGTIDPKLIVNITRMIELMFFEKYVKGDYDISLFDFLDSYDEIFYEFKS